MHIIAGSRTKRERQRYQCKCFLLYVIMFTLAACNQLSSAPSPSSIPALTVIPSSTPIPTHNPLATPPESSATPRPTHPVPDDWETRWLRGIPCTIPCWEGVTPGVTTAEEALTLLRASPLVATADYYAPHGPPDDIGRIRFDLKPPLNTTGGGLFGNNDTRVTRLSFQYPKPMPFATIQHVLGDPSHVQVFLPTPTGEEPSIGKSRGMHVELIYLTQGVSLLINLSSPLPDRLSPEMPITSVTFFAPGEEGYFAQMTQYTRSWIHLVPWQGFQHILYYCRAHDGEPCLP